ncbi:Dyp-type peroxidase [Streptomyces celluloflavus]|uniref:Dyp-type peroxidase n=2 Tax=Streptomyces TaxID=1883 RepID=A0A4Q9HYY3_STRKA|nr:MULTISPECIES: Dyp-type peroxidase [Streptomyces]MYU54750.1 Dyp-type peroxidase [Streptomyces sp. SID7805]TBO60527.1 Dyp-type peroxidase [Streptomyces kasugaensis]WSK10574.1 Dyp-type peroxidase [Streptomyces celluloflavus]
MTSDRTGDGRSEGGRRGFLKCAAGLAGVAAAGGVAGQTPAYAAGPALTGGSNPGGRAIPPDHIPFHGRHQSGIVTEQQVRAGIVSFDVLADDRRELIDLFRTITERARVLVHGLTPKDKTVAALPATANSLTLTLGVGASLFDDRYGLAPRLPRHLREMPSFPNDDLDPERCHGDLSLQIGSQHHDVIVHVLHDLAQHTDGMLRPRWRMDGFLNPSRPTGAPRTFVGFKDGISNPNIKSADVMNRLMWVTPECDEPDWAVGGCYQVVRLILFDLDSWDQVDTADQEKIFGRRKGTGAPLDGKNELDKPDYDADPDGKKIPLGAHIRLANPQTPETADSHFLRRSYNYDGGFNPDGTLDVGLLFCAYQQDVHRQFAAVQWRLVDEPLSDYVTPVGGGYFFVLPGVRDSSDWLGSGLLYRRY